MKTTSRLKTNTYPIAVICTLIFGGVASVVWGQMTFHYGVFSDRFGMGVGATAAILIFGLIGRIFTKNKLLGHAIATAVITPFAIYAQIP
ncbi:hypothetical protein [Loktanella salsilacus]|uniref:hypothetical protein n=1 Tax=Loktanella salsilacus TaxID=195913 RepID=UPI0037363CA2